MPRAAGLSPRGPDRLDRRRWTPAAPGQLRLHNGQVAFRTSPYGALSQLRRPTMVACEIDDIQPDAGSAWSVLVRGRAEPVTSSYDLVALWSSEEMVHWATGTRNLVILISERSITGRALSAQRAD